MNDTKREATIYVPPNGSPELAWQRGVVHSLEMGYQDLIHYHTHQQDQPCVEGCKDVKLDDIRQEENH